MSRFFEGYATTIDLGGVVIWELESTPPGIDGGNPINVTSMRNTLWETQLPKTLKKLTMAKFKCAFAGEAYNTLNALINVNRPMVITLPDGKRISAWGWLRKFIPDPLKEGEQPTADVEIEFSLVNNAGVLTVPTIA